jgi:hypothetical protein
LNTLPRGSQMTYSMRVPDAVVRFGLATTLILVASRLVL